jgi:hypothetical protein
MHRPCLLVLFIEEDSLKDVVLERLILGQLRLERGAVKAHFELAGVGRDVLDVVHG